VGFSLPGAGTTTPKNRKIAILRRKVATPLLQTARFPLQVVVPCAATGVAIGRYSAERTSTKENRVILGMNIPSLQYGDPLRWFL
jgi:hypothetical protein